MKLVYTGIFLILFSSARAQVENIEVRVSRNYRLAVPGIGLDPGVNGAYLQARVNFLLKQDCLLGIGGELGANGIGNYLSGVVGVSREIKLASDKIRLSFGVNTQHGIALFRPSGIYMVGIGEENSISYRFQKGNSLGLVLELRYFTSPGYSMYSDINSFIDLQTGIKYSF